MQLSFDLSRFEVNKKGVPNSERSFLVQEICDMLGEKNFGKILGQTSHLPLPWLREIYNTARSWKTNPRALFWKLIKESKCKSSQN